MNSKITEEITLSNKPIQLYKRESLYVKDMVVVKENKSADNGVIHEINCVMFVQPSQEDDRLTKLQKRKFPITSCCMQTENEINSWLDSVILDFNYTKVYFSLNRGINSTRLHGLVSEFS